MHYLPVHGSHGPAAARNARLACGARADHRLHRRRLHPRPGLAGGGSAGLCRRSRGRHRSCRRPAAALANRLRARRRRAREWSNSSRRTASSGASCAIRAGGFDERFSAAWREDSDLHFRLLHQGGRIVWAPAALVVHPWPARWGVSLKQQRKSQFNALLYKKHPRLYRQRIRPWPPWEYYAW